MSQKKTEMTKAAGRRLEVVVQMSGLSKGAFAKKLGVSQQRLSNWLGGAHLPPLEIVKLVRDQWKISLDWLFLGETDGQTAAMNRDIAKLEAPYLTLVHDKKPATKHDKASSPRA